MGLWGGDEEIRRYVGWSLGETRFLKEAVQELLT